MRIVFLAFSALAALATAQDNSFNNPSGGYSFTAGKPTTLTWTPTTQGTVSLQLQWGSSTTASQGVTIASSIPNSGTFTWVPPASLAAEPNFTIRITDDANPSDYNFLPQFTIAGVTGSATATTGSLTASSSSASSTTLTTTSSSSSSSSAASSSPSSSAASSTPSSSPSSSPTSTPSSSPSSSSAAATSTSTTASSSSSTPTSVPNTNGGSEMKAPAALIGLVAGAIALM